VPSPKEIFWTTNTSILIVTVASFDNRSEKGQNNRKKGAKREGSVSPDPPSSGTPVGFSYTRPQFPVATRIARFAGGDPRWIRRPVVGKLSSATLLKFILKYKILQYAFLQYASRHNITLSYLHATKIKRIFPKLFVILCDSIDKTCATQQQLYHRAPR
jgi:hypothetical protein